MDLQILVFFLFLLFTAGHSLSCYKCTNPIGSCADPTVETCPSGSYKCSTQTVTQIGSTKVTSTVKECARDCEPATKPIGTGTASLQCCDSDLCNAADGMCKGSFLLLLCPLFFYFLFHWSNDVNMNFINSSNYSKEAHNP
ncbi:prostate stem cell antigen isoform X2 [Labeo rohita]|nr:prostate stem cell antigen isoform X2 [Labeo rohita]